jgi:hypothetical protein
MYGLSAALAPPIWVEAYWRHSWSSKPNWFIVFAVPHNVEQSLIAGTNIPRPQALGNAGIWHGDRSFGGGAQGHKFAYTLRAR